jgi:PAS domain-containing protein
VDKYQFAKNSSTTCVLPDEGIFVDREFNMGQSMSTLLEVSDSDVQNTTSSIHDIFTASFQTNAGAHTSNSDTNKFKATANFRQTVNNLGAAAAIITFKRMRPIERRQIYLVGFHDYAEQPVLTFDLMEFAETGWMQTETDALLLTRFEQLCADSHLCPDISRIRGMLSRFDHMAFSQFSPDANSQLSIALFRSHSAGAFVIDLHAVLPIVQPMLADIASAQMDAQRAQRRISILEGMLDTMSHGVILLDAKARSFYANDVAGEMIANTGLFTIGNDQILRCFSSETTHGFHQAVQKAVGGSACNTEEIVKLQGRDGRPYLGFLTSASGRDDKSGNRAAFLFIHDMKVHCASPALMGAFGLLPSEQRFLGAFLEAPSLADAADQLGLSEETARTYVKRICSKVGVRRQLELASVMFGMTPPIRQKRSKNQEKFHPFRQSARA